MTTRLFRVEVSTDQVMHLGVGRGSGFSATTRTYVPGSTLRGALCAAWWREHPGGVQAEFDALVQGLSLGDAVVDDAVVPAGAPAAGAPLAVALDRLACKYPGPSCPPTGHDRGVTVCPACAGPVEPSKGQRPGDLPKEQRPQGGSTVLHATRVTLTEHEQAEQDRLFEREALQVDTGRRLVALAAGEVSALAVPGLVLRIGAAGSVAGRAVVHSVTECPVDRLDVGPGTHRMRVELLTCAVFVDDFGFAANTPSADDVAQAFALPDLVAVTVDRAFTRWTTASGWHTAANVAKPEDAAVVAHSTYHLTLTTAAPLQLPRVVHDLGLRTTEGYGWALLEPLQAREPGQPLGGKGIDRA